MYNVNSTIIFVFLFVSDVLSDVEPTLIRNNVVKLISVGHYKKNLTIELILSSKPLRESLLL